MAPAAARCARTRGGSARWCCCRGKHSTAGARCSVPCLLLCRGTGQSPAGASWFLAGWLFGAVASCPPGCGGKPTSQCSNRSTWGCRDSRRLGTSLFPCSLPCVLQPRGRFLCSSPRSCAQGSPSWGPLLPAGCQPHKFPTSQAFAGLTWAFSRKPVGSGPRKEPEDVPRGAPRCPTLQQGSSRPILESCLWAFAAPGGRSTGLG